MGKAIYSKILDLHLQIKSYMIVMICFKFYTISHVAWYQLDIHNCIFYCTPSLIECGMKALHIFAHKVH